MDDGAAADVYRTPVAPLTPGIERPLWSVMIPTYHCARYLRDTLASVLAQDQGAARMQIEVIDDHSTDDDPEAVVREVGRGRVGFVRQPANVGHTRTFDLCLDRSRGLLVHLLHGDDLVREGFYERMQRLLEDQPGAGAAFSRYVSIDDDGHWLAISPLVQRERGLLVDWLGTIATGQRLQACAMVVRRDVYERLGGFDHRIQRYGEDWEMWVRIAAQYAVAYEPEPLAFYRVHAESLSGLAERNGQARRDLLTAIDINRSSLPPEREAELTRRARRGWAVATLRGDRERIDAGGVASPLPAIRDAWAFDRSPTIVGRAAHLLARWVVRFALGAKR